ncbi:lipid-A-disaccharide synthase-like uncharacterized protein [Povalibacter uvarum]|uniref:Lipid-A-disaccharide synthase-like uncharacterized protein n=1 Tax=Povalibacter uvarum TaxID=732238 RepID=A0A841HT45_9GAMM|nr:DUF4234 domain-containing protein [Povalibacter uvarum]MBB6095390.1 lipid-A-disaccharide synthase-like uncharacterized protein [Povalibacter uvarum]
MSGNPYAPPAAVVEDIPEAVEEAPYFAVSVTKLIVLMMCTFGLYQIYWFYQNWRRIKQRDGSTIMPAMRSIFSIFFCYQCFDRIRRDTDAVTGTTFAAGPLASFWILSQFLSNLPDPYWLISILACLVFVPVQLQVNRYNEQVAPTHDRNGSFSAANWIFAILGGAMLLLVMLELLMPGLLVPATTD